MYLFLGPLIIIPSVNGNMTGTSVLTSTVIDMKQRHAAVIQATWTGTPTGSFSIQQALDYSEYPSGQVQNPGIWIDMGIVIGPPAGSSGSGFVDMALTGVAYLRLVYTNSSGTGTLIAYGFGK